MIYGRYENPFFLLLGSGAITLLNYRIVNSVVPDSVTLGTPGAELHAPVHSYFQFSVRSAAHGSLMRVIQCRFWRLQGQKVNMPGKLSRCPSRLCILNPSLGSEEVARCSVLDTMIYIYIYSFWQTP